MNQPFRQIFNNQKFVLTFTGILSLAIASLYYIFTILPYISVIGFWNFYLFFDAYTLLIILWFMSILVIHSITNPAKYCKYFNTE